MKVLAWKLGECKEIGQGSKSVALTNVDMNSDGWVSQGQAFANFYVSAGISEGQTMRVDVVVLGFVRMSAVLSGEKNHMEEFSYVEHGPRWLSEGIGVDDIQVKVSVSPDSAVEWTVVRLMVYGVGGSSKVPVVDPHNGWKDDPLSMRRIGWTT